VIRLSRRARTQVFDLANHYAALDRPEAVRNMRAIVARAGERIEAQRGPFFPAPRSYPNLTRPGWLWLKEGPYWIAFVSRPDGAVMQVVFHEAADIPGRL
jgi:plasmid stabilization system protein ParE